MHDAAARLRDMLTARASPSTCQLRAKGDDLRGIDLPASWKQEDVRLVLQSFLSILSRNDLLDLLHYYSAMASAMRSKHDTVWMKSEINVLPVETKLDLSSVV